MNASDSPVNTIIISGAGKVTTLADKATIQVSTEDDGATRSRPARLRGGRRASATG